MSVGIGNFFSTHLLVTINYIGSIQSNEAYLLFTTKKNKIMAIVRRSPPNQIDK